MALPGPSDTRPVVALAFGLVCAVVLGSLSLIKLRIVFLRPDWGNVTPQLATVAGGTLAVASLGSFGLSVYTYVTDDETDDRTNVDIGADDETDDRTNVDIEVNGRAELTVNTGDRAVQIEGRVRDKDGDSDPPASQES